MRPDDADRSFLLDMLEHAQGAVSACKACTFEQYDSNENLRLATERRIKIIGEAARKLSPAFKDAHPDIPWQKIISQRHVLAHEYGEIESELIWRVVTVHLPELIDQREQTIT